MVVTSSRLAAQEWREDDAFVPLTYEKVVGLNNLLRISWLSRALELAAPVARVLTPAGPGSGFLIGTDLLLTNHHVLPDVRAADGTTIEFNYQVNWAGELEPVRRYKLDGSHFHASEALDYAMVRVKESPGDLYGFVDLAKRSEPTVNDFVSIIQHPQGGMKQICFTDNKVSAVFDHLVQYSTDTEPGSSGSPVFNQRWEIVGLHHRGGGLAGPDGMKYFTNEGILISAILRDAAAFLGVSDTLYELAFGELRAELVGLVDETQPPTDVDALATELLRARPRFSAVLDDWSALNGRPGEASPLTLAIAGVAVGGALRQWARTDGHESIKAAAASDPLPSDALVALVSPFNGSETLPVDVYAAILASLRGGPSPAAGIATGAEGLPASARAFLRGVSTGAKAFDRPAAPDRPPAVDPS
ncbi:MAG: trypsin-like peptidase domain-containing protein [Solirubrobacteraceae bacterium]